MNQSKTKYQNFLVSICFDSTTPDSLIGMDNKNMERQNHYQVLIQKVSGNHFFQYRMFVAFIMKWIMAAMLLFSLNFFFYLPNFTCTDEEMYGFDTCQNYVCSIESENFWLDHLKRPLPKSISLDFGTIMVCSNSWLISVLQSCCYFGSLMGYIFMPMVADNKGRKIAQFSSWLLTVIGCGVLLISVNIPMIGIGNFLMGFGSNAAIILHYSFIKELVVDKLGQRMMVFLQISFAFGVFCIALVSWLVSDWKYNLGVITVISVILLLFTHSWIEQTPEFSLSKGRHNLLNSLNKISQKNKGQKINEQDLQGTEITCQRNKENKELSFFDLFRYDSLFKLTIVCAIIDFILEFTYDGTILSLDKLGIDIYVNQMMVGSVEIIASIYACFIIDKVQRKRYCQVSFLLVTIFTTMLGILSLNETNQHDEINVVSVLEMIVLACLRITLNAVWGIFFVFIAELYPAEITSVSFGWINIIGTVGGTISPFIRLVTAKITLFLMALLNIISFFLIQRLDETKGKEVKFRIKQREEQIPVEDSILSKSS